MTLKIQDNEIRLSTVGISDLYISEYDQNLKKITIPTDKVFKMSLVYGCPVERPLRYFIICFVLFAIGSYLGLWPLFTMFLTGDKPHSLYSFKIFAMAIPSLILSVWLISSFFQRKYYLNVETDTDKRKIVFEDSESEKDIKFFLERVKSQFGLRVEFLPLKK